MILIVKKSNFNSETCILYQFSTHKMKYIKPFFVLNTEFSILKKANIAKALFKHMYKEVLASWKGCSCPRSLLDPNSFYVNSRINVCSLPESSHHHPSSHKAKFPEPPGGAREGQVAYDGCRSALKTILPGADGPGFPTPGLCLYGWMSTNREGGTTQVPHSARWPFDL